MTEQRGKELIDKVNEQLEKEEEGKYKKNIEMIIAKKNREKKKEVYLKAVHDDGKESMDFVAKTQLLKNDIKKDVPKIFYGGNNGHWYYFLEKNMREYPSNQRRYYHQYYTNNIDLSQKLAKARLENPGQKLWIIVSDKK